MAEPPRSVQDFEEAVARHTEMLYNLAYRMLGNSADAEEAVQEAFLSAYRNWDRFRGTAQVSTWLYRICVNACLMRLRKEKRARYLTVASYEEWDAPVLEGPEHAALNTELRERLEEGLALLPPQFRAPVVLRDVQGFSNEAAADMLGVTVASFKTRLHRGRVLLRRFLEEYLRARR